MRCFVNINLAHLHPLLLGPAEELGPDSLLFNELQQTEIAPGPDLVHCFRAGTEAALFNSFGDRVAAGGVYDAPRLILLEKRC